MNTQQLLIANFAALVLMFLLLWSASLFRRDVSIVDIFWGLGFVLVAWLSLLMTEHVSPCARLLAVLVTVWGLRLAGHLARRNWGKPEDSRYAEMRRRHGRKFPLISLLTVFGLQGLLMWVISLPIQVGIAGQLAWDPLVLLGLIFWAIGMFFEAVGDYQLARFKSNPANRGRVMDRGLWRYTRHPNYFGDFLVWWGFYFVAAEPTTWWWTIIGPLLMSFLLIRVSGVRLLERSLRGRVAGYEEYARKTSAFFPLPPKGNSSAN